MDCLDASVQKSPLEWLVSGVHDEREWSLTRSECQLEIGPYRMACSWSAADVRRNYVDTTVPQLIADFCACLLIEASVELAAPATVDGCEMLGDLLVKTGSDPYSPASSVGAGLNDSRRAEYTLRLQQE